MVGSGGMAGGGKVVGVRWSASRPVNLPAALYRGPSRIGPMKVGVDRLAGCGRTAGLGRLNLLDSPYRGPSMIALVTAGVRPSGRPWVAAMMPAGSEGVLEHGRPEGLETLPTRLAS